MAKSRDAVAVVLLVVALSHAVVARFQHHESGHSESEILNSVPDQIVQDMWEAHPEAGMMWDESFGSRRQAANGTANATELPVVGTSVICMGAQDLKAMALDTQQGGRKYSQYATGKFECEEYVDYAVACDVDRQSTSCNNRHVWKSMQAFNRALSLYNCKSYSRIWTCDNCTKAYKRWLCATVYRKFYIPNTAYHEEGDVRLGSAVCACPIRDDVQAAASPMCVNICNGMPQDCDATIPTCPRAACGSAGGAADPGKCQGSIYLSADASSTTGFYVGAKVELIKSGQWAVIEHYDGYTKLAMFRDWTKPYGKETTKLEVPSEKDKYRIYLTKSQRGVCKLADRPKVRQSRPCGQMDAWKVGVPHGVVGAPPPSQLPVMAPVKVNGVDSCLDGTPYNEAKCASPGGFQAMVGGVLQDVPYKYPQPGGAEDRGGARCGEDEVCVAVDKKSTAAPLAPESGYACCPKSGYSLQGGAVSELWRVYVLQSTGTDAAKGLLNYTCHYGESTTKAAAIAAAAASPIYLKDATVAKTAINASGCLRNFTGIADKSRDDCSLKTCSPVCFDVERRCPKDINFKCPGTDDRREYEHTLCNMMVPHGCTMDIRTGTNSSRCAQLNPGGYGPMNDPSLDVASWMLGSEVMGLSDSATCEDRAGLGLDNGRVNPPTNGPAKKRGPGQKYEIMCDDGKSALDATGAKDGKGCREMMYPQFYDPSCPHPGL